MSSLLISPYTSFPPASLVPAAGTLPSEIYHPPSGTASKSGGAAYFAIRWHEWPWYRTWVSLLTLVVLLHLLGAFFIGNCVCFWALSEGRKVHSSQIKGFSGFHSTCFCCI